MQKRPPPKPPSRPSKSSAKSDPPTEIPSEVPVAFNVDEQPTFSRNHKVGMLVTFAAIFHEIGDVAMIDLIEVGKNFANASVGGRRFILASSRLAAREEPFPELVPRRG